SSPYQRDSTVSQFPESMSYNWAAAGIIYNKLYVDNSSLKCRWGGAEITDYLFVADFVIPDRRNVVIKEYIFDIIVLYQTLNNFLSFLSRYVVIKERCFNRINCFEFPIIFDCLS